MGIKSYFYERCPEIFTAGEFYNAGRDLRKAGFVKTPLGFQMAGLPEMQNGTYEPEVVRYLTDCFGWADLFVDVGANMGYYTCLARSMGLKVVAVEPLWQNLQFIYANLEVNGWTDVEVFPVGLLDKPGLAVLYGVGTGASFVKGWAGGSSRKRMVPLSALEVLIGERFSGLRAVIKIDVEGVEYGVLQGARQLLVATPAPVWVVEAGLTGYFPGELNADFIKVFELFWKAGYSAFDIFSGREFAEEQVRDWVRAGDTGGHYNFIFRKET